MKNSSILVKLTRTGGSAPRRLSAGSERKAATAPRLLSSGGPDRAGGTGRANGSPSPAHDTLTLDEERGMRWFFLSSPNESRSR